MEYAWRVPAPALRTWVHRLHGYAEDGAPVRRRELPSGQVVLILSFGPPIVVAGERRTSFVGGLVGEGPTFTEHDGEQSGVEVELTPLGATALLGVPAMELTNAVVDLDAILGRAETDMLAGRLAEAPGWRERFDLLDDVLAARLAAARPPSPEVAWAFARLVERRGAVPIGGLVERLGCSHRHLAARFREQVGVTPKAYARLLRFEHVAETLRPGPSVRPGAPAPPLAALAAACGYADQAHMTREVRAFAGCTPRELATEITFVQEAAGQAA